MLKLLYRRNYMAGTITHTYFVLDLYDKLSIKSKELLIDDKNSLKLFAQNNDVLFFYNELNYKKAKRIRMFGYRSQQIKVDEFFSTLINYIKYNNHQYNPQVISYLYGMLSHYVLDSTVNPYIIYKAGRFNKKDKNTYKYNGLYQELENYFDNYMLRIRKGINPYKFKCYDFCFNIDSFNKDLIEVMDFTYKEVFGINDFHKYYLKASKKTKKFYKLFRYDPYGFKKRFYKFFDLLNPGCFIRKVPISYHTNNKKDYLNLEHNKWYNPTDKRTKSNESYLELYTKALDKASKMIYEINKFLYYDKKINLKKVVGNLSYETGKDCGKEKELKYFEF